MSFLIKANALLMHWECIENIMKFGKKWNCIQYTVYSETVYSEKYLKAKIKSYNGKINTKFLL